MHRRNDPFIVWRRSFRADRMCCDGDHWLYVVTSRRTGQTDVSRSASTATAAFDHALMLARIASAGLEIRQPNGRLISIERLALLARAEAEDLLRFPRQW